MGKNPPLIAHVVHHFRVGGMENGMINLINHMPKDRFRHVVICLDDYTDFRERILRKDVEFYALAKPAGRDVTWYFRLWRLLRKLSPAIVHTRNLSAIEGQFVAFAAGIRARIHGEHGRDVFDLHGENRKYNLLRKLARPFVGHYIAVSRDLEQWLIQTVGVKPQRVSQIYNGVDSTFFRPRDEKQAIGPADFAPENALVIGSVGRMAEVKDYPNLVRAFIRMLEIEPTARQRARLVIIGEGVSREICMRLLKQACAEDLAWLPGESSDVAPILRNMDLFVLPSLGEGISNTILEAMSSGLPIIATRVGGNPELVEEGQTGAFIPVSDPESLAQTLLTYYYNDSMLKTHGQASRKRIESQFSIPAMVQGYLAVYEQIYKPATV
ncbi:TIGR03088 family PEP-CTERM/XrtA system glycosyltransferase [Sulfurirhabdus autotrophica]|uniref:Sugar transferase (PEP-CTERM/EpsH1 system associated) n=1 Tax=Sulfurirhabdus autotrophica TaxID=1706046 RepID=A0A4R3Y8H3_9PROT|nr:TIGR03088 family PEP-CTERM/XrtA system glycosyltransferase [Sulfurirhabdus autotrophica]TCV88150.1 sugar transferase (PEP-CTERM/EpsH1 system associated) [Sulfurirhabdus autotrophica]